MNNMCEISIYQQTPEECELYNLPSFYHLHGQEVLVHQIETTQSHLNTHLERVQLRRFAHGIF